MPVGYGGIRVIGIDPGSSGAIAYLTRDSATSPFKVKVVDLPTTEITKTTGGHTHELDISTTIRILRTMFAENAFIEKVHSMKAQGVASSFTFGQNYGTLLGILGGLGLPTTRTTPQQWKRDVMIRAGSDKNESRRRAMELFPDSSDAFKRDKDHGRADAALIAYSGALRLTSLLG